MAPALRRCAARSTLVSHVGQHHADRSFLLVRERPGKSSAGECLALHGSFDQAVHERLSAALLGLTSSRLPLTFDLRGISALDEGFLTRLLKAQREMAPHRSVFFQIADDGPVLPLIRRFGLEARFGLEPAKRLSLKRIPVSAFSVSIAPDEKSAGKAVNRDFVAS